MSLTYLGPDGQPRRYEPSPAELISLEHGVGLMSVQGRQIPFAVHQQDDRLQVWLDGRIHTIQLAGGPRRSHGGAAGSKGDRIAATMPGTVLAVRVSVGDHVEAGQPLVLMESMKMEMSVEAPRAGRVRTVSCQVGQLVELGAVLIQLEDDAAE